MKTTLLKLVLIVLFLAISLSGVAQETFEKGAHQMQKEQFGAVTINSKTQKKPGSILGLSKSKVSTLNKKVFGFLPYWEQSSGAHSNIRYDLLTHVACFDFLVQLDASISTPAGWPWTAEINAAHASGTKVVMTVVNFGGADGADAVAWELFTNNAKRDVFFANVKNIIQTYNLDGVNIDFEGMTSTHRGAELNTFMAELRTYIHNQLPGKEVSFCGPAVNWGGWVIDDLVNSVDYLIVMAYDYVGSSSANTGPVAPLTHHTSWKRYVKRTIETGTYKVPTTNNPEKLILAVPYYGQHWKTATNAPESTVLSYVGSTRYRNTITDANNNGGFIWNTDFESPWYRWNDGTDWNQVWADNELSISKKFDLAISNNLGGVGMWALNYDGNRPELWELINTKFAATASVDNVLLQAITIYPNPTSNYIYLAKNKAVNLTRIEMFNILGESLLKTEGKQEPINIAHLANGLYILKVEDQLGRKASFKIVKSN